MYALQNNKSDKFIFPLPLCSHFLLLVLGFETLLHFLYFLPLVQGHYFVVVDSMINKEPTVDLPFVDDIRLLFVAVFDFHHFNKSIKENASCAAAFSYIATYTIVILLFFQIYNNSACI